MTARTLYTLHSTFECPLAATRARTTSTETGVREIAVVAAKGVALIEAGDGGVPFHSGNQFLLSPKPFEIFVLQSTDSLLEFINFVIFFVFGGESEARPYVVSCSFSNALNQDHACNNEGDGEDNAGD